MTFTSCDSLSVAVVNVHHCPARTPPSLPQNDLGDEIVEVHATSAGLKGLCCYLAAVGIEDLHFHDLRHGATASFFRMGLDIPRVALLTGHKTWAMLRRYTDIKPADVHAAVARHTVAAQLAAKSSVGDAHRAVGEPNHSRREPV